MTITNIVVHPAKSCNILKLVQTILPLRAEVVDLVFVLMVLLKEALNIVHVVPVDTLQALGGKPHCNDPWGDVGQIQVKTILTEPQLLLAHKLSDHGCRCQNLNVLDYSALLVVQCCCLCSVTGCARYTHVLLSMCLSQISGNLRAGRRLPLRPSL